MCRLGLLFRPLLPLVLRLTQPVKYDVHVGAAAVVHLPWCCPLLPLNDRKRRRDVAQHVSPKAVKNMSRE